MVVVAVLFLSFVFYQINEIIWLDLLIVSIFQHRIAYRVHCMQFLTLHTIMSLFFFTIFLSVTNDLLIDFNMRMHFFSLFFW